MFDIGFETSWLENSCGVTKLYCYSLLGYQERVEWRLIKAISVNKNIISFNILISIRNLCQVSLINRVRRQPIRLNFPFFVIRSVVKHLKASRRRENYRLISLAKKQFITTMSCFFKNTGCRTVPRRKHCHEFLNGFKVRFHIQLIALYRLLNWIPFSQMCLYARNNIGLRVYHFKYVVLKGLKHEHMKQNPLPAVHRYNSSIINLFFI